MKNNDIIRLEKSDDYREVENLTREAFWNVYRPGCTALYLAYAPTGPRLCPGVGLRDGEGWKDNRACDVYAIRNLC